MYESSTGQPRGDDYRSIDTALYDGECLVPISSREAPVLQRTDPMIASSGLAACRAICNLRVLRRLRHNYRRGVGERERMSCVTNGHAKTQ